MNNASRQQIVIKPKNGSLAMALLLSRRDHLLLIGCDPPGQLLFGLRARVVDASFRFFELACHSAALHNGIIIITHNPLGNAGDVKRRRRRDERTHESTRCNTVEILFRPTCRFCSALIRPTLVIRH